MQLAVKQLQSTELRVFIVEDSANVVTALKELVDVVGNARIVGIAPNETIATEWATSHRAEWDVAVVDILLDQGNGFTIIQRLKQQAGAGRIAVFSAYLTEVIKRHCLALGADAVFDKSDSEGLAAYIERLAGPPEVAPPAAD